MTLAVDHERSVWEGGAGSFQMLRKIKLTRDFGVSVFNREVRKASEKGGLNNDLPWRGGEGVKNGHPTVQGENIPWEENVEVQGRRHSSLPSEGLQRGL